MHNYVYLPRKKSPPTEFPPFGSVLYCFSVPTAHFVVSVSSFSPRSSRKKDRRQRSKSPYGPAILQSDDNERPNSRSKKKKHRHHRHKNHSPSPLGLSPSPTPSPAPKAASADDDKSSVGSGGSPHSVKSGMSVESSPRGGRRSGGRGQGDDAGDKRASRSSSSAEERGSSSAKEEEKADTDSSYD